MNFVKWFMLPLYDMYLFGLLACVPVTAMTFHVFRMTTMAFINNLLEKTWHWQKLMLVS